jgi:hypothetical protein
MHTTCVRARACGRAYVYVYVCTCVNEHVIVCVYVYVRVYLCYHVHSRVDVCNACVIPRYENSQTDRERESERERERQRETERGNIPPRRSPPRLGFSCHSTVLCPAAGNFPKQSHGLVGYRRLTGPITVLIFRSMSGNCKAQARRGKRERKE